MKVFAFSADQEILGTAQYTNETSVHTAIKKYPDVSKIEVRDADGVTTQIFDVIEGKPIDHALVQAILKASRSGNRTTNHGKSTQIVRDFVKSGKDFTREQVVQAIVESQPEGQKSEVRAWNIVGSLLEVARREGLKPIVKSTGRRTQKIYKFVPESRAA